MPSAATSARASFPPPGDATTRRVAGGRERLLWALLCWALLSLPLLLVEIPPITDLPQQLAQIHLLSETLSGASDAYRVQWLTPNKASYPILGLAAALFEPFLAGRAAMVLIAGAWILAVHFLAAAAGRSVELAIAASVFAYSHVFYMGYANFALGLAAFIVWFVVVGKGSHPSERAGRAFFTTLAAGLLLYYCHALWFAVGVLWLLFKWLIDSERPAAIAVRGAAILPIGLLSVAWYLGLGDLGWRKTGLYGPLPWRRLAPDIWVERALGGVSGWLEPLAMLVLVALVVVGLWQHRRARGAVDRTLLMTGLFFLALYLLLPDKQNRTIHFSSRWAPVAATFLLLSVPVVRAGRLAKASALVLLVAFSAVTTSAWLRFEREDLTGFRESLAALPQAPRLLALDYVRESELLEQPPFLQLHSYAQLLVGGSSSFSFADHASSLVIRKNIGEARPWTEDLEWHPEDLRPSDLDYFDFVLAHTEPGSSRERLEDLGRLTPVTTSGRWRLYSIAARDAGAE